MVIDEGSIVDKKLSVFFSIRQINLPSDYCDYVLICPVNDGWNNFGYTTIFNYRAKLNTGVEFEGKLHLAFLGDINKKSVEITNDKILLNWDEFHPQSLIKELLGNSEYIKSDELPQFFSMSPTMQGYRDTVSSLGAKLALDFLMALNDLIAINYRSNKPEWLNQALDSNAFKLSFMRDSEAFFCYQNAGSILDGIGQEIVGEVSSKLDLNFKLNGFSTNHTLGFNFDQKSILPKRICVVIGENGVGKSQSLSHIVKAALINDVTILSDPTRERPALSRLIAIGTPGEARVTFPQERRGNSSIYYRRLLLNRNNGKDGWRGLGDLLVQLARSKDSIKGDDRWTIFCKSINNLIPLKEIALQLRDNVDLSRWRQVLNNGAGNFIGLEVLRYGGEQASLETWGAIDLKKDPVHFIDGDAYSLSSGQLAFIRFAALACLYLENGTLFLLDEPEIHLHPSLISGFVELLNKLLEVTGSIAIIATHSVYFVREVPRSQVFIIKATDSGHIDVLTPRLKTFGADVGAISSFVFDDSINNKLIDGLVQTFRSQSIDFESASIELRQELSVEALIHLRQKLQ